jgi:hypothetical protein
LNLQVEIDSLRGKLSEEEISHKKLQEQLLIEKLKRVMVDVDINDHNEEVIRGTVKPPIVDTSL